MRNGAGVNPGERIVIERVGNGWTVSRDWGPHDLRDSAQLLVFNEMGYAQNAGTYGESPSLLTFIAEHFAERKPVSSSGSHL